MPRDHHEDDLPPPYSLVDEQNQQNQQTSSQQGHPHSTHTPQVQSQAHPSTYSFSHPHNGHHTLPEKQKPSNGHSNGFSNGKPQGWGHNPSQSSVAQSHALSHQVQNQVHHQVHGQYNPHYPPTSYGPLGMPHGAPHHPPGPLRYPRNYFCRECSNTGIKPSGYSCKDCWDRFGPRNNQIYTAPHPPRGPARVVMPGDPSIGGILCGRCRGTGVTHELLLFEEPCRVCGGIGRIIR